MKIIKLCLSVLGFKIVRKSEIKTLLKLLLNTPGSKAGTYNFLSNCRNGNLLAAEMDSILWEDFKIKVTTTQSNKISTNNNLPKADKLTN